MEYVVDEYKNLNPLDIGSRVSFYAADAKDYSTTGNPLVLTMNNMPVILMADNFTAGDSVYFMNQTGKSVCAMAFIISNEIEGNDFTTRDFTRVQVGSTNVDGILGLSPILSGSQNYSCLIIVSFNA